MDASAICLHLRFNFRKIKFAEICATQTEQDWCWSARDHRFHEEVGMLKEQGNSGILPYSRRASLIVELSQTV